MQRWMLYAVLGLVGLMLLGVGGFYARREYYNNKPSKIWVPLPVRVDLPMDDQKNLADQIRERLRNDELLLQVVRDAGLQAKFKQASEEAAVEELRRRLFVEVGKATTPMGEVPSVNIGVKGLHREREVLGDAATRIIEDVWRMLGIDPKTGQRLEAPAAPPLDSF